VDALITVRVENAFGKRGPPKPATNHAESGQIQALKQAISPGNISE